MAKFEQHERQGLYAVFTVDEHEIREGATSKDKTKIQWFVYVRREAIINRLDDLFFGEWESGFVNNQQPYQYHQGHVDCAMHITIRGMRREYNGSQDGGGLNGAKGAATDAFKRVASQWGIGLYLQNAPMIWTDNYKDASGKPDWNKKRQVEAEAMRRVADWLKTLGAKGDILRVDESDDATDTASGKDEPENITQGDFTPPATGDDSEDASWLPKIYSLTEFLYDAKKHQYNSIEKLIGEGSITRDMKPIVAASMVFAHKANEKFTLRQDDITDQLGKSLGDYLRSGNTLEDAWQAIQVEPLAPTGTEGAILDEIPF
jgi:hypothetical protein